MTTAAPSRLALIVLAVLIFVAAVFVCVLYGLTPEAERVDLLGQLAPFLGGAALGIPAVLSALTGRSNSKQLVELQATTDRVEHQTNGALTQRLHDVISEHLDARGLLVPQAQPQGDPQPQAEAAGVDDGSRWWDNPVPPPVVAEAL